MSRPYTNKLIEAMDAGLLDPVDIAISALSWMSEDDVKHFCQANDWIDLLMGDRDED